jgi:hypothetical protein
VDFEGPLLQKLKVSLDSAQSTPSNPPTTINSLPLPLYEKPQPIAEPRPSMGAGGGCYRGVCSIVAAGFGAGSPARSFGAGWSWGVCGLGGAAVLHCVAGRAAGGCRVFGWPVARIPGLNSGAHLSLHFCPFFGVDRNRWVSAPATPAGSLQASRPVYCRPWTSLVITRRPLFPG